MQLNKIYTNKNIIWILLCILCFGIYITANPNIIGTDSYFFLSHICEQGTPLTNETELTRNIFANIPCNIVIIKIIQFSCALLALFGVVQTANIFHKKNAWLAGIFVFLAPVFFFEFAKFESEIFAYPLLFWANYFILKGIKEKKWLEQLGGLALIGLAGLLWKGAIYYIIIYGLITPIISPFTLGAILIFRNELTKHLMPNNVVWENFAGIGPLWLGVFLFSTIGIFLEPLIIIPSIAWLTISFFNAKFTIHAVPFLAIATLNLYNNKNLNNLDKKYGKPIWGTIKIVLIATSIIMCFMIAMVGSFAQPPTTNQVELVQEFVSYQQQGYECKNDWSYGYWVKYWGGEPTAWGGGEWIQDYNTGVILSGRDLNCTILGSAREMKLYTC